MSNQLNRYRVYCHTSPFPGGSFYQGKVDVWATDEDEAGEKAQRLLTNKQTGTFFDRSPSSIVVERVECVG